MNKTDKIVPISQAFLSLKNSGEVRKFLRDLMTPQEIRAIEERWAIAQILYAGNKSYRTIAEETGASVTTVTRVARFLRDEPYQGYITVLNRVQSFSNHTHTSDTESVDNAV